MFVLKAWLCRLGHTCIIYGAYGHYIRFIIIVSCGESVSDHLDLTTHGEGFSREDRSGTVISIAVTACCMKNQKKLLAFIVAKCKESLRLRPTINICPPIITFGLLDYP